MGVVGKLEAGVDVLLVAGKLAGRHVPDVGLDPGGGADVDRPHQVRGDLGVPRLEADLDVAFPLEVGVEGQEVDHPRALAGGERGDGLQLGEVVADHRDVEPERDAELAEVVQRPLLTGGVVPAPAVDRAGGLADAVDGDQEVVDARPRERGGPLGPAPGACRG